MTSPLEPRWIERARVLLVAASAAVAAAALFWPSAAAVVAFTAGLLAGAALWWRRRVPPPARAIPFDDLAELVCSVSTQGALLGLSRGMVARVGPSWAVGRPFVELFAPERRAEVERALHRALTDGAGLLTTVELAAADGRRTWVEASLSRCTGAAPPFVLCVVRDVEDRVVLERKATIDQTVLERVVDATDLAMLVYRAETGECVLSNAAATRLLEESLGASAWHLRDADFFRSVGWLEACDETIRTGLPSTREAQTTARSGERRWLTATFAAFTALDGRFLLVGLEDFTQAREGEAQLRLAKDTAEAGTRAKAVFLANMSHEIRTPLNGVLGSAELLLETPLEPAQRELAQTLHRSAASLLTILNDILDFSKVDAGALRLEAIAFELEDVVFDVVELFRAQVVGRPIDLLVRLDPALPARMVGDPGRIRQVLGNLVSNAIKFTQRGFVRIDVQPVEGRPGGGRLSVTDTGIGISHAQRAGLFQSFSQGDPSTARRFGGTGLGLAIAKALAEAMGGALSVHSVPGRGTTFVFELALPPAPSPRSPLPGWPGRRAVVVEADPVWRELLVEALGALGLSSTAEVLAPAAVEAEVVVCELDAVARLASPSPPLLILAPANAGPEELARCDRGLVLQKPVRPATLYRALAALLSGTTPTPRAPPQPGGAPGPRVLLADDNAVNQLVAAKMLHKLGARVVVASDGREALDRFHAEVFDLVLMDCQMPEMDGYTAAMAIRAHEAEAGGRVPIVALTASALPEDRARSLAAGMDAHLPKPVTLASLEALLRGLGPAGAVNPAD